MATDMVRTMDMVMDIIMDMGKITDIEVTGLMDTDIALDFFMVQTVGMEVAMVMDITENLAILGRQMCDISSGQAQYYFTYILNKDLVTLCTAYVMLYRWPLFLHSQFWFHDKI